ncbi:hypothetical protein [Nocardioides daphniae]|uniref:Uncharacterized protein n=1 Tax=Nocardioides daphniae TaxID=402297 RepID=A0A4V1CW70_9ACTN|nr:hypothetical protein [Nocardioides daphniae]QCC76237.1 hypothetical protein E2C04_01685 [Nocardioides daphniae]GGD08739.1 hypothetical protein GCM10007231_04480 [Nocardioides daphniae]
MGESTEQDRQAAGRTPRRASPVASVAMLLVAGIVWFFLHNLADLHYAVDLLLAAVAGGIAGFVVQEVAGRRRGQA